jgi:hypothetical protein
VVDGNAIAVFGGDFPVSFYPLSSIFIFGAANKG